ncbi:hypothetical protein FACS1894156_9270 [Bacteroidia bacterium]|nr:hypothetical protein FACS1894156_9270 [Bacteroidia bacterium]
MQQIGVIEIGSLNKKRLQTIFGTRNHGGVVAKKQPAKRCHQCYPDNVAEGGGMFQTVIMGVVNVVFTLIAIATVDKFGRKPLLIIGSIGMAVW